MYKCVINGRFLSQPVTGVQRYAGEVVSAVDALLDEEPSIRSRWAIEILTTSDYCGPAKWNHISIRRVGRFAGHLWEQIYLPRHLEGRLLIGLTNTGPMRVARQIVTIHDASVAAAPAGYSTSFRTWYKLLIKRLGKKAQRIATDSEFSRGELNRWFDIPSERISVIPLGGEHILRQPSDHRIFDRLNIGDRRFVLSAGSLNPNKNIGALAETATRLQQEGIELIVAGGANAKVFKSVTGNLPSNIRYLGYIADSELRALYERAICFVFPSKYEGFGLPPLEAMSCGCPVVTSNTASLSEVCGNAVCYIDPGEPRQMSESVMRIVFDESVRLELSRLGKERAATFTWANTAREWLRLIESFY